LSDFLFPLFTQFVACCMLRPADPGRRRRLQPRRDAAAGGRGRQGAPPRSPPWFCGPAPGSGCRSYASRPGCCQTPLLDQSRGRSRGGGGLEQALSILIGAPRCRGEPALQRRHRHPPRRDPGPCCPRLPAELPRILRKSATSSRAPTSSRARSARRPGSAVHTTCCSVDRHVASPPCRDLRGHLGAGAPSSHAALAGAEVLIPVGQQHHHRGKAEARRLLCGSQSARGIAALRLFGFRTGRVDDRSGVDGHASDLTNAATSCRIRRASRRTRTHGAPTSISPFARSGLRNNGFADFAMQEAEKNARSARCAQLTRRATAGPTRAVERFPYDAVDRPSCVTIATKATTSRSRPGTGSSVSRVQQAIKWCLGQAIDSTLLDGDLPGDDQLRLPRKNVMAYTLPARPRRTKPQERLAADDGAGWAAVSTSSGSPPDAGRHGHPFANGKKVYDVTSRTCRRAAYRLSVPPGQPAQRLVVGTGDLSELGLLVHLRRPAITCRTTPTSFSKPDPAT